MLAFARPALLESYARAGELVASHDVDQAVALVRQLHAAAIQEWPEQSYERAQHCFACGGALLGLRQWHEAESLLRTGYRGIKQCEADLSQLRQQHLRESLERIVKSYEQVGRAGDAAAWREQLQR